MEYHKVLEQLAEIVRILRKVERKIDEQERADDAFRADQAKLSAAERSGLAMKR